MISCAERHFDVLNNGQLNFRIQMKMGCRKGILLMAMEIWITEREKRNEVTQLTLNLFMPSKYYVIKCLYLMNCAVF